MFKRFLYTANKSATDLLVEYRRADTSEFCKKYKIKLNEDGTIFDCQTKTKYDTLSNWAKALVDNQEVKVIYDEV